VRDQVRVHLGADAVPETCTPHPAQHESESLQSTVQASVLMEGTSFRLSSAPAADCWRVKVKFASAPPIVLPSAQISPRILWVASVAI
jgi:hypothetical protein